MATKQVNNLQITVGSGAQVNLPQPVKFDPGKKCPRIRARIGAVMANSSTAYNMTAANLITLLSAIVSNWYLAWGNSEEMSVDPTLPFSMMRLMFAQLEGKDFTANDIAINAVSGSAVQVAASPALTTITFEFIRSFTVKKQLNELHDFCPGTSQMQQIQLGITPSNSAAPTFSSGTVTMSSTTCSCEILFEQMDADSDQWAQVPMMRQASPSAGGQNIPLPVKNGGSLIAVADLSHAASGYALTLFELTDELAGAGKHFVQGLCQFGQALSGYFQDLFNGDFDWSALAAPLYTIPTANDVAHLDSVKSLNFYQPNNDITSPLLCVTFVNTQTPNEVNSAGVNILGSLKSGFKLTNAVGAGTRPASTPQQVAAVLPLQIRRVTDPAYSTAPGQVFAPNQAPTTDIPAPVLASAQAAAQAQPGGANSAAGSAQLARSTKSITNAVPGYASPGKTTGPSNAHLAIATSILGHGVSTSVGQSKAKSTAQSLVSRLFAVA